MHRFEVRDQFDGRPGKRLEAVVEASIGDTLTVVIAARHQGDPPPVGPSGRLPRLWEHEVVEFFLAGRDGYIELEVGPHGHHLALSFAGVRELAHDDLPVELRTPTGRPAGVGPDWWTVEIGVARGDLPAAPWRANAFAIHGTGRSRVWLAAHPLPGATPDFHQPARFPAFDP